METMEKIGTMEKMEMSESILTMERFIERISLQSKLNIKRMSITENRVFSPSHLNKFNTLAKNKTKLELYHCTRSYNYQDNIDSIFKDGLYPVSASNKGYGIYLAAHSNYSVKWGGCNHVFVCEVIVDEAFVTKHISEVYSPKNNWEYVVTNRHLIYPKYLIEYELEIYDYALEKIYTNAICERCLKDCACARRCDCPHLPIVEEDNVIC